MRIYFLKEVKRYYEITQRIKESIRKVELSEESLHIFKIKLKSKRIGKYYSINFTYYKLEIYYKK